MTSGYYRFPTIHDDTIVFVSEDDLWTVPVSGGVARRLTSNLGEVTYPALSPDGKQLAFVGREEGGMEVYVMPAEGGSAQRLTYLNSNIRVVGWTPDGTGVIFTGNYGQPAGSEMALFVVRAESRNGTVEPLPYGPARSVAYGPRGQVVIGRNTGDPARWKRYRGGTAGHLWIDRNGDGTFARFLPNLRGNIAAPAWIEFAGAPDDARVYFVSDHEGVGNLYSSRTDGSDLRRHTDHEDYYVRNPSSDGRRIVYHVGADIYVFDPAADSASLVEIAYHSPRVQRNRKFVDAGRYLDSFSLNPSGKAIALTTRGKAYGFYAHEGPVLQFGKRDGVRYRRPDWLVVPKRKNKLNATNGANGNGKTNGAAKKRAGDHLILVSDEAGEETIEIHDTNPNSSARRLVGLDLGRVVSLKASPTEDQIALTNHRNELVLVDVNFDADPEGGAATLTVIDRSPFRTISGFDWSPDGRWIAYSYSGTSRTSEIRLYRLPQPADAEDVSGAGDDEARQTGAQQTEDQQTDEAGTAGAIFTVTRPVLHDVRPAFDPDGKYLYFLSYREFNPVYDGLHFDLGFPWGMRPYLLTLQADLPNPFVPMPEPDDAGDGEDDEDDEERDDDEGEDTEDDSDGSGDEDEHEGDEDDADEEFDDEYDDDEYDDDGYEDDYEDEDVDEGDADEGRDDSRGDRTGSGSPFPLPYRRRSTRRFRLSRRAPTFQDSPAEPQAGAGDKTNADGAAKKDDASVEKNSESQREKKRGKQPKPIRIDLDGIEHRVIAFPVSDSRYGQIAGLPNKAVFTVFPIHGQLDEGHAPDDEDMPVGGNLRVYDFKEYRLETLVDNVSMFDLSRNRKKLIYTTGGQLRVINAGEKPPSSGNARKTGWINLHRVKVSVDPQSEWEQMFREAWRLQRDHFWTEDMSQVDWQIVYHRYYHLIPRAGTRSEFSDIMWEMQGELGTSHAYEFGGDYRPRPYYGQGFLGATWRWDGEARGYRIEELVLGDPWDARSHSPLAAPGVNVRSGDLLIAINGQPLDEQTGPAQLLVNQAGNEVLLTFAPRPAPDVDKAADAPSRNGAAKNGKTKNGTLSEEPRSFIVRAIHSEARARYRSWVDNNRRKVHEATDGRVGYIHIPDMGPGGYAEFHRGYLAEVDRDGLIIDVRYNGGGHVSQLILEKLARRRIGYELSRWGGLMPYPMDSAAGPMVALTNELAGSDGDIFCHSFKLMKLGPLIGKRTWGGVIGISPRHQLVDGTITTQPEYSFWFEDVSWNVENYGTDPDIEVDITPQDHVAGNDPQLDRAIQETLARIEQTAPRKPDLAQRPSRALPKLPPRT